MKSIRDFNCDKPSETQVKSDLESIRQKYEGKSKDELMQALMQTVAAAKRDGSFSDTDFDEFVGFVSPSLDGEQRQRLNELVGLIKNS